LSDFHETFVNTFNGSVKNDVSLEKDSHILKAINTGEFRPVSRQNAFVEGMPAFKMGNAISNEIHKIPRICHMQVFFQVIRGAVDQSSDFV
jgi:hypothetical protein